MGYYPILKTTWKYFPEKKGFLTGLILCVFGLCPFAFTSISDAVINPDGVAMVNDFYPEDVAENMKTFALIMSITMGACGALSQLLMFPLDDVISTDKDDKKKEEKDEEKDEENKEGEIEEIETKEDIDKLQPFKQAVKSWRFHMFNLMSVGTLCKFFI
jgi:hypothetical protein